MLLCLIGTTADFAEKPFSSKTTLQTSQVALPRQPNRLTTRQTVHKSWVQSPWCPHEIFILLPGCSLIEQEWACLWRSFAPEVGLLSPDRMAREMFGWQPVYNVMEGHGTVSAGHGALRLHAYLVHCKAYAGPLT